MSNFSGNFEQLVDRATRLMAEFGQTVPRPKTLTSLPLIGNDSDRWMLDDSRAHISQSIYLFRTTLRINSAEIEE